MKMKFFYIIIFLFFTNFTCLATTKFSKFDSIVFGNNNIKVLERFSKEELKKYYSSKEVYYLYNSKYVDAQIAGLKGDNNGRIKILNWIVEDGNEVNHTEQITIVYYHLACILAVMNSPKISQDFALKALNNSIKYKYNHLLYNIYGLIAMNYYRDKNFSKAAFHFKKSLLLIKDSQTISAASMLNNISLCLMNLNKNKEAKHFYIKAINILKNIKNKSGYELDFLNIVEGNLGTVLNKLGKYEEAIILLQNEIKYCFAHSSKTDEAVSPIVELMTLYVKLKREKELKELLIKAVYLENKIGYKESTPILTEYLYKFYQKNSQFENALKYANRLFEFQKKYTNSIIKQSSELNEIIYREKIQHLNDEKKSQDKLLALTLKEKRSNQVLFFTILCLGFLIVSVSYRSKRKNRLKDAFIQDQNKLLLENENKLQQEKITNLAINLTLKKNTEKAFLTKINELKKKNNIGVEQVIKELQFSVSNLLNIDKKLIHNTIEAEDIHHDFKIAIAKLHPELTKTDITFCCYFRLKLSAKEISALQGVSDGSVRVIKNRIKNKLNLLPENSISDYLIHI